MANQILLEDVRVDELMTERPATVEPEASLSDAAEVLLQGGFRHLPVVSAEGRPVGMISERDIRASLGTDLHGFTRATLEALAEPVSGVMTPDPVAVRLGTRLGEVLDAFTRERVGAVLVVDEAEKLRGILSYVDVLLWLRAHPRGLAAAPRSPGGAGRPARRTRPAERRPGKPGHPRSPRRSRPRPGPQGAGKGRRR